MMHDALPPVVTSFSARVTRILLTPRVYLLFVTLMEVLVLCRLRHQVRRLIGEHDPFIVSPFFTGDPYIAVLVDLVCIE